MSQPAAGTMRESSSEGKTLKHGFKLLRCSRISSTTKLPVPAAAEAEADYLTMICFLIICVTPKHP